MNAPWFLVPGLAPHRPGRRPWRPALVALFLSVSAAEMRALEIRHTPPQPRSGTPVTITAKTTDTDSWKKITLQVQLVDPGRYIALADPEYKTNWFSLAMTDAGTNGDNVAGDRIFTAVLPPQYQLHRRLVRYRLVLADEQGAQTAVPAPAAPEPNFAYFTYDGVPGWSGAINPRGRTPQERAVVQFSAEAMRQVPAYHLIARASAVEKATWYDHSPGKEYRYTGSLVFDGKVYDHVRFRARGGVWRYAMGKNMWKIDFNRGHFLEARDDYGRLYRVPWGKLNLRACIQQGDYGHRGEQGLFEAVGFRLFNLAGVESPRTHFVQWRIIDSVTENPADQYRGDFWGLYLALENEDGQFLKEHALPDGNLYKMMMGMGELSHHGAHAPLNGTDLRPFLLASQRGNQSDDWWRANFDLPRYYSYRSILEAIHHYDVEQGKNYDYYFNPVTRKWMVIPWDIDLTWADNMYGGGNEPLKRAVLGRPAFMLEYQNRLREIRDLLFNPEQTGQLIGEYASFISDPSGRPSLVDADRMKWDYHPIMISPHVIRQKAGHGRFYQASATGDFAGMKQLMKDYVKTRSAYLDRALLGDEDAPSPPKIASSKPSLRPQDLRFHAELPSASSPPAATQWRLGEITDPKTPAYKPGEPFRYEITPVWQSAALPSFQGDITVPPAGLKAGRAYRTRVRIRDRAGRWSHWSAPAQFVMAE